MRVVFLCALAVVALGATNYSAGWGGTCASGSQQSPILLEVAQGKDDNKLAPLEFTGDVALGSLSGATFSLNNRENFKLTVDGNAQGLDQINVHWGSSNLDGAEHSIQLEQNAVVTYAAEAQFVFGTSVVSLLFSVDDNAEPHAGLAAMLKKNASSATKALSLVQWNLNPLAYYTYQGSKTSPPCDEGITWFVLATTATVTSAQMDQLRAIFPDDETNSRPIQPFNDREIGQMGIQVAEFRALSLWEANKNDNESSAVSDLGVAGILMLVWFVLVFISGCILYRKAQKHGDERTAREENEQDA
mmetsp:Transcript_2613/g.3059  ORF Transcript_2613/g.3059 Transcript_2613/m.3059 type:complete len:303 (+) Transcript_2613:34-942(+)|eukprot:CAMPEP_0205822272 /NCGR_PEP_ID=MMETSP0206-20130828/11885_1 /ASSEMBLY_ACC=CAM_ASM_000279 /TAXON_ID=36767 /ORGANISM="Euplotes focardii, Strain TN1" /LENGTH=302 /DNA_ID=CAMNT_0053118411 /DNA_START=34 /DNA_END=942 /DNA_ORIENTATION=+